MSTSTGQTTGLWAFFRAEVTHVKIGELLLLNTWKFHGLF